MTDARTLPAAEPMRFTDNPLNPLELALYEGLADPAQMPVFERMMLDADLYAVPGAEDPDGPPPAEGPRVFRQGERLILRGVVLDDGRDTIVLFTDPRRAAATFGEDARVLAMNGRQLLGMLRDAVVLLNPAEGKGLLLDPARIRALLEQTPAPARLRPSGTVELFDVPDAARPVGLIARLGPVLAEPDIEAAWLAAARWAGSGQTGWRLEVRTLRPAAEIVALVERAVRGLAFGAEVFDVAVSRPGAEDAAGMRVK